MWDAISGDLNYSKLAACLQAADPSLIQALRDSQQNPLTLFAPGDSAFEEPSWDYAIGSSANSSTIYDCK